MGPDCRSTMSFFCLLTKCVRPSTSWWVVFTSKWDRIIKVSTSADHTLFWSGKKNWAEWKMCESLTHIPARTYFMDAQFHFYLIKLQSISNLLYVWQWRAVSRILSKNIRLNHSECLTLLPAWLTMVLSMWSCRESISRSPTGCQVALASSACVSRRSSWSMELCSSWSRSKARSTCVCQPPTCPFSRSHRSLTSPVCLRMALASSLAFSSGVRSGGREMTSFKSYRTFFFFYIIFKHNFPVQFLIIYVNGPHIPCSCMSSCIICVLYVLCLCFFFFSSFFVWANKWNSKMRRDRRGKDQKKKRISITARVGVKAALAWWKWPKKRK